MNILRCVKGTKKGSNIDLKETSLTIGRRSENNLHISEKEISKFHAKLELVKDSWILKDMNSHNGIKINDYKIENMQKLKIGDVIAIGKNKFIFTDEEHMSDALFAEKQMAKKEDDNAEKEQSRTDLEPARPTLKLLPLIFIVSILLFVMIYQKPEKISPADKITKNINFPIKPSPDKIKENNKIVTKSKTEKNKNTTAEAQDTFFYVKTNPAECEVKFDGILQGNSPLLIENIKLGKHTLEITHKGYSSIKKILNFPVKKQIFTLLQAKGTYLITSTPTGATIFMGDKRLGKTPYFIIGLKDGEYKIKISDLGYQSFDGVLEIDKNKIGTHHQNLIKQTNIILVRTVPPNCKVFINDKLVGITHKKKKKSGELSVRVSQIGKMLVKVVTEGENESQKNVILKKGSKMIVEFKLWHINIVLHLKNRKKIYGMYVKKHKNGNYNISLKKGTNTTYYAAEISRVESATDMDKRRYYVNKKQRAKVKPSLPKEKINLKKETQKRIIDLLNNTSNPAIILSRDLEKDYENLSMEEMQKKYKRKVFVINGIPGIMKKQGNGGLLKIGRRVNCYFNNYETLKKRINELKNLKKTKSSIAIKGYSEGMKAFDSLVLTNCSFIN